MALHQVVEKHKATILGQEITYTNKYIKYTKGTSHSYKPPPGLISYASSLFKYTFEHPYLGPTLHIAKGKKYLLPMWKEVHPKTTYNDIDWVKPTEIEVKEKGTFKFESSSAPGTFYIVRQNGFKLSCNCPGVWRAKDRRCKHIKEVEKKIK